MKQKTLVTVLCAFVVVTGIQAQSLSYTFDSDAEGFQNFTWSASGPAGWAGGSALQAQPGAGGWTLGGSFNYYNEFDFASGAQPVMQALSAGGNGRVSFDLMIDGTSFNAGEANWFQFNIAGNSAGAGGWTQVGLPLTDLGDGWHNADDNTLFSTHVDLAFADVGWQDPDDATGWFQLYFGANSDAAFPVGFYIDNVEAYAVPEPTTFALAGLGVAALLISRRRN